MTSTLDERKQNSKPVLLSLFTGAGGLDIGLERAGFCVAGCIEIEPSARKTIKFNRPDWNLFDEGNIHNIPPSLARQLMGLRNHDIDLLCGGPPCQPFSKSSYWVNGLAPLFSDPRARTIEAFFKMVEHLTPRMILLENVPGIQSTWKDKNGKDISALDWIGKSLRAINRRLGTSYSPIKLSIDAADFGIPQHRHRIFIFASRDGSEIVLPKPTHGPKGSLRYTTAWDSISDIITNPNDPNLILSGKWAKLLPSIPEGENYLWHTERGGGRPLFGWRTRFWSFLLKLAKAEPSWTLQANPGPATGPFHWSNRKLSLEEIARLQTFPDGFQVLGGYRAGVQQIGNAVPPAIGELLGYAMLFPHAKAHPLSLIPSLRDDCPAPDRPKQVPKAYLHLEGLHPEHPGAGLGPRAKIWKSA